MNLHEVTEKIGNEPETPLFDTDRWARIYEQWLDTRNEGRLRIREGQHQYIVGPDVNGYYMYRVRDRDNPYYGWNIGEVMLNVPLRVEGTLVE